MSVAGRTAPAVMQLEWSIRLFLDHHAFLPAATLAAAAQALLQTLAEPEEDGAATLKIEPGTKSEAQLRELAVQQIAGALTLLVHHDRTLPSEGPRFLAWLARRQEEVAPGDRA